MGPDCLASQAVLQRSVSGLGVTDLDLERALAHVAACDSCSGALSSGAAVACAKVEADLASYADALGAGRRARRRWPALARHLEGCERCAEIVAELVQPPPTVSAAGRPGVEPDVLFERALRAGLTDPDPVVRERAAARLGRHD
jgi:hypothetical protein